MNGLRGRSVVVATLVVIVVSIAVLAAVWAVRGTLGVAEYPGAAGTSVPADGYGPRAQTSQQYDSTAVGGDVSAASPTSKEAAAETPDAGRAADALIIRNSAMEVRVDDVDVALPALRAAVAKVGGEISDMSMTAGDPGPRPVDGYSSAPAGPATAYVTIRVAADRLTDLENAVGGLGDVLSISASASDVTEQAIDLDARLKNLRAEEARLRSLFDRTNDVSDLLEVERELARVRGEIESMDAQLTYLKRQAARATLTVTLSEPGPVVQPPGTTWGLREAVTRGIQATAGLLAATVTIAIPLAALGALALVVWLPIRWLRRHRKARRLADTQDREPNTDDAS